MEGEIIVKSTQSKVKEFFLFFFFVTTLAFFILYVLSEYNLSLTQSDLKVSKFMEDYYFDRYMNESLSRVKADRDLVVCEQVKEQYKYLANFRSETFCYCSAPDYPSFVSIADKVADEHTYDINSYNCVDFSEELVERLEAKGWSARTVTGNYDGQPHEFVVIEKVYVEATSGLILEPSIFNKYYELD
jgi:hypothetical protein